MAYISHSSFDYRSLRERAAHVSPSLMIRSGLVAVAAAVAILALSEVRQTEAQPAVAAAAAKADRLAAPTAGAASDTGAVVVDVAARTTTVERGTAAGLSPQSPMNMLAR